MANKYLIQGATYCGTGTSSAEATSNGGIGAWNDINVLEGSAPAYGSAPAAGDLVYIRSKTSAGADITRTVGANISLGSSVATASAPIEWVLDDGAIWTGITGYLTYTASADFKTTLRVNNVFTAKAPKAWVIKNTSTNPYGTLCDVLGRCSNFLFDTSAKTGTNDCNILVNNGAVLENAYFKLGRLGNLATDTYGVVRPPQYAPALITLINPEFELTSATASAPLLSPNYSSPVCMRIIGGRVFGIGSEQTGQAVFAMYSSSEIGCTFDTLGFTIPRSMLILNPATARNGFGEARITGSDSSVGGHIEAMWGFATSRTDNNPPYLAATIPDSVSSMWSWRVYPRLASAKFPVTLPAAKMFSGAAAQKTITQELLVANTMALTKLNTWMLVQYIDDSTGLPKIVSTRDMLGSALDSSTATWSVTTWGMITCVKNKLSIQTPTAVKQNTLVNVVLMSTAASATANDILFIDPDFGVN